MAVTTAPDYRLQTGDCLSLMRELPEASLDVVVTSPPYNIGVDYHVYADTLERSSFLDWCAAWGAEIRRLLKPQGSFFLNLGAPASNPLLPHQMALRFSEMFVLQNTFHWIKSITVPHEGEPLSVGHYKPINSGRYVHNAHEYIFHFTPEGTTPLDRLALGVPYQDKSNIARWKGAERRDRRCRGNTWFIPYKTIQQRATDRPHPATFPVELPEYCLRLHGVGPQSAVLDPFLGSGSTAIACAQLGVGRFAGFDIDSSYVAGAMLRLLREGGIAANGSAFDQKGRPVTQDRPPTRTANVWAVEDDETGT